MKNKTKQKNKKKTELSGYIYHFAVDFDIIDTSNIINIHK